MKFPADYPYSPPTIRFLTKVWHPNVYEVCILFKSKYKSISYIILNFYVIDLKIFKVKKLFIVFSAGYSFFF
jgi:hypothetical protein